MAGTVLGHPSTEVSGAVPLGWRLTCSHTRGDDSKVLERAFDLLVGAVGLAVFGPLIAIMAAAVMFDDGAPVFFQQERLGRSRRSFRLRKIRTMRDQQVTRVGALLRRTGLDETAQFLSVIEGTMRVVGPRPLTQADVYRLGWGGADMDARFSVKPGITGVAQVFGGISARHSWRLDRLYLNNRSVRLDLELIIVSFLMNLFGKRRVRTVLRRLRRWRRTVRTGI